MLTKWKNGQKDEARRSVRYKRLKKIMRRVIEVLHCDIDCAGYFAFFNDRTDYETLDLHFVVSSYNLTKPTMQRFDRRPAVVEPPSEQHDVDGSPGATGHDDSSTGCDTRASTTDTSAPNPPSKRARLSHSDDDPAVSNELAQMPPPLVAGARSWRAGTRDSETMRETMSILGSNWHKGGLKRAMVSPEYLGSKLLEKSLSQYKNYDFVTKDTDTKGYTYKIYCNGERYGNKFISYIFKGDIRVDADWAIGFVICDDILIFSRLCILNRELTNMYLDFLHKTFCSQRHESVHSKVTMLQLTSPEGRKDKAQTLIAQSVGFKKDFISNYTLTI